VFVFLVGVDIFSLVFDKAGWLKRIVWPIVGGDFLAAEELVLVGEFGGA
jgi:hypothetical protein